jgi:ribosomal protein L17
MPTPKKGPRLGGSPSHQRHILKNLATQLILSHDPESESALPGIKTTEAKAKAVQPYFEKLVTKARRGSLHDRRIVARKITDKNALYVLFDVLAPKIDSERQGGYTRIVPIGNRKGDNAPMAYIEVVTEPVTKKAVVKTATATAKKAAEKQAEAAEEAAAEEIPEDEAVVTEDTEVAEEVTED